MPWRPRIWAVVVALATCLPDAAVAAPDPPDPGHATAGTVMSNGTEYRYLSYTPTTYRPGRAAPLLVMVHGCQTTAEQEMRVTRYNALAEREGFVVLYPDVDALGRTLPGPANQCWKFPYPPAWTRGNSDAAAIADMTRAVMAKRAIDPERVYLMGISAGGLMASIEAAAYPDLYAAVGVSAASAYTDWTCFTTGIGIPAATSAQLAFAQMGPRARIVPTFVLGGDADQAFPWSCTQKALEQGLRTNSLVLGAGQEGPIALAPAAVRREQKPGGHAYTVASYRDPAGCLIGESWRIHGMGHFWSGGTADSRYAGFTDTKGPNAAEASWAFFTRYRKSDTAMPCAEAPGAASAECLNSRGGVSGTRLGPAVLNRTVRVQRRHFRGKRLHTRRGMDRYCAAGGGSFRIGYLRGVRPGSPTRVLRARVKGERRVRVGRNTWYLAAGRKARLVYRVRGRRVQAVGIAGKRMTRTAAGSRRLLTAWALG